MRTITDKQAGKFSVLVLLTAVFFAVLPGCSSDRPVESVATSFNSVNGNLPTIATTPDTTLGHGDDGWFHMAKESAYTLRVIKWNPKNENPPDTTEFYLAECVYVNQYSTYSAYQWWSTALGYGTYMMLRNCESSVNDVEWEMPNVWAREDIAIDTVSGDSLAFYVDLSSSPYTRIQSLSCPDWKWAECKIWNEQVGPNQEWYRVYYWRTTEAMFEDDIHKGYMEIWYGYYAPETISTNPQGVSNVANTNHSPLADSAVGDRLRVCEG